MLELIGSVVVVRDHRAGVHVGTLKSVDVPMKSCVLTRARKVWYWTGAASCHGLAVRGLNHAGSKVCAVVERVVLFDVVEIVSTSESGARSLMGAPEWRP